MVRACSWPCMTWQQTYNVILQFKMHVGLHNYSCDNPLPIQTSSIVAKWLVILTHIVTAIQRYVDQINESVKRRNFHCHAQQTGETFDHFLVSLCGLAKTCNFCSNQCTQKNIRDQIIEGLLDGVTVEDLLKEKDLTLEKNDRHMPCPGSCKKTAGRNIMWHSRSSYPDHP